MGDNDITEMRKLVEECINLSKACHQIVNDSMTFHFATSEKQEKLITQLIEQTSLTFRMSDERLNRVHTMVTELSGATNRMAKAFEMNNKIVQHLEKTYTSRIDQAVETKEQFHDAYVKLLHEYEAMKADYLSTLKEFASRPTTSIHND